MGVKELREKHLLSKTELAKIIGCSQTAIWKWENGQNISYKWLRIFKSKFNLTDDELKDLLHN